MHEQFADEDQDPRGDREPQEGPGPDAGMATAEYAMATLAACGFAALLIAVLRSDEVRGMLLGVVRQALTLG
ncbi:DUF4244 domain-containing protein [Kineococcus sp. SYSU DK001]|uniref:DUF4244 domain-containing protein n=1 Tax=Kineococcus sp. SYSU DK001 TaxID=3383122 RepID=UPI003D7ECD1D